MMLLQILFSFFIVSNVFFVSVYAQEEEDVTCYLDSTCDISANPISVFFKPLSHAFTVDIEGVEIDLSILAVWGTVLFIIWLRSHNMMLVGIVGIFLTIALQTQLPESALNVGYVLLAFSIGVVLFKLFIQKTSS